MSLFKVSALRGWGIVGVKGLAILTPKRVCGRTDARTGVSLAVSAVKAQVLSHECLKDIVREMCRGRGILQEIARD